MTQRRRYYYLWNIGCQMNRADAQRLAEDLERRGFVATRDPGQAAVMVLNTCVVRQSAQDRVAGRLSSLSSLKKAGSKRLLVVMGCFVGDVDQLEAKYPFVDRFVAPSDLGSVLEAVDAFTAQLGEQLPTDLAPTIAQPVADMVPISYGCDHHCTYCIVTIRRGPQRSRPISDIVADCRALADRGAKEITLLGQNVDAYGTDWDGDPDLADVLYAVHEIEALERIRFLTSHPREMSQRIIDAVGALPRVCESWELAVQSGDDGVLKRMARGYTVERVHDLVERIRQSTPGCGINTDVIVGFCGETEAEFENTMSLLQRCRFDMVHVAAYSVRPGTPAALWEDDVPQAVKIARRERVEAFQEMTAAEINGRLLGSTVEILVDGKQKGRWRGRTRQNKLVFFEDEGEWLGQLADVKLTWTGPWSMRGDVQPTRG